MDITKQCPTCRTVLSVNVGHEWEKLNGRHELTLALVSQSTNIDTAKMEGLFPLEPDGQELVAEPVWVDDRTVQLKLYRRPVKGTAHAVAAGSKKSRADMETEAVELGLEVNPKWNDIQLGHALAEKRKAK